MSRTLLAELKPRDYSLHGISIGAQVALGFILPDVPKLVKPNQFCPLKKVSIALIYS